MRIPSGTTDQYIYFVAVDSTDFTTRETGLSSFTVYRSRNGAAAAAMTTPTINEVDATNMPGVYELLLDEDMTIGSGNDSEEMAFHITQASMAPVTRVIELYRPKSTVGETLTVSSGVASANAVQLSGDATAADNAEAFFDDTGFNASNSTIGTVTSNSDKTGYRLSSTGVDDIWDEPMSGHVTAGSAGATLPIIRSNTAQAGASTTITLDASASATDDFYNDQFIFILSGTGAGQGRIISDYNGTTKVATVSTWAVNPSSDSVFVITPFGSVPGASAPTAAQVADAVWDEPMGDHQTEGSFGTMLQAFHEGTAQAGTASSITLDATGSSSTNDFYNYAVVEIVAGTGAGQSRQITDYNGTSKVASVAPDWTTTPSTDSEYVVRGLGIDAATTAQIADAVWDEDRSAHQTAGTFGEYVLADSVRVSGSTSAADGLEAAVSGATPLPANVTQISGDATAADNLESYTDGTTPMPVNATQISGDATAADNAELFFDGTGYDAANSTIGTATNVGTVTGNVDGSVGSVTGNVGGNVVGTIGELSTQAKADVNAEVVDALATDTYAELAAIPAATASLKDKITFLYMLARNKVTQTSSAQTLRNDADDANVGQSSQSDNGTTYTKGEWS